MQDEAPDEVAFDDRFLRLVADSDAAVERLEDALQARDRTALVNALQRKAKAAGTGARDVMSESELEQARAQSAAP